MRVCACASHQPAPTFFLSHSRSRSNAAAPRRPTPHVEPFLLHALCLRCRDSGCLLHLMLRRQACFAATAASARRAAACTPSKGGRSMQPRAALSNCGVAPLRQMRWGVRARPRLISQQQQQRRRGLHLRLAAVRPSGDIHACAAASSLISMLRRLHDGCTRAACAISCTISCALQPHSGIPAKGQRSIKEEAALDDGARERAPCRRRCSISSSAGGAGAGAGAACGRAQIRTSELTMSRSSSCLLRCRCIYTRCCGSHCFLGFHHNELLIPTSL